MKRDGHRADKDNQARREAQEQRARPLVSHETQSDNAERASEKNDGSTVSKK